MHRKSADPFDMGLSAEWLGTAPASEQLFFAAAPVAHVVAYEDHCRESRLARLTLARRPEPALSRERPLMTLAADGSQR
jgi:hypothetical protein